MIKMWVAILTIFLCSSKSAYSDESNNPQREETMCYPHEEIYFSCHVDRKIVSICASGNISPKNGYVQYRFGRPGKPELEFPSSYYPPRDKFSISDFYGGNLNSVQIKFRSGQFTYVVFQSASSGVYVTRHGKTVRSLLCEAGQYRQISPRAMRGIRIVAWHENDDQF